MADQQEDKNAEGAENQQKPASGANSTGSSWKDIVAAAIGVLSLAGFAWLIIYMVSQVRLEDLAWTRLAYLLTGVEAIAFSAAGFFFGSQVSRKQAEAAEEDAAQANEANQEAQQQNQETQQENVRLTTNAKAMGAAIEAKNKKAGKGTGKLGAGAGLSNDDWAEIHELSKALLK